MSSNVHQDPDITRKNSKTRRSLKSSLRKFPITKARSVVCSGLAAEELRVLYYRLGRGRTLSDLQLKLPPHLAHLSLQELDAIATKHHFDKTLEAWDAETDRRISQREIETQVQCATDLKNILADQVNRFKTLAAGDPNFCIIRKASDVTAITKALVILADRNPDGSKKAPGQLEKDESARSSLSAAGHVLGALVESLSGSEFGKQVLDKLGQRLEATANAPIDVETESA